MCLECCAKSFFFSLLPFFSSYKPVLPVRASTTLERSDEARKRQVLRIFFLFLPLRHATWKRIARGRMYARLLETGEEVSIYISEGCRSVFQLISSVEERLYNIALLKACYKVCSLSLRFSFSPFSLFFPFIFFSSFDLMKKNYLPFFVHVQLATAKEKESLPVVPRIPFFHTLARWITLLVN